MTERLEAKRIDGSRKRERIIIRIIRSHPDIHHNELKRLVVPRHMAIKTFERIIKDFTERKVITVQNIKNRKHYSIILGFPDSSVKVHLKELLHLVDEMRERLTEMNGKYARLSKNRKEQIALDLSHMYYDTRFQVVKVFEMLGKDTPVVLGEYDSL